VYAVADQEKLSEKTDASDFDAALDALRKAANPIEGLAMYLSPVEKAPPVESLSPAQAWQLHYFATGVRMEATQLVEYAKTIIRATEGVYTSSLDEAS
jgi:hypothetical protein